MTGQIWIPTVGPKYGVNAFATQPAQGTALTRSGQWKIAVKVYRGTRVPSCRCFFSPRISRCRANWNLGVFGVFCSLIGSSLQYQHTHTHIHKHKPILSWQSGLLLLLSLSLSLVIVFYRATAAPAFGGKPSWVAVEYSDGVYPSAPLISRWVYWGGGGVSNTDGGSLRCFPWCCITYSQSHPTKARGGGVHDPRNGPVSL